MASGPITLIEYAKGLNDDKAKGVVETFAKSSNILDRMQWENIQGNAVATTYEQELPESAFRAVNQEYASTFGRNGEFTDTLKLCGGQSETDDFLVKTEGPGRRGRDIAMKVKSLAHLMTQRFFKGDSQSDPLEFDGVQKRAQLLAREISAGSTANGAAFSLSILDEALDETNANLIVMPKILRRRLNKLARTKTSFEITRDNFGRPVLEYNGVPIVSAFSEPGQTDPLPFTEAAASGTATASSVYALQMSPFGLHGIQSGPPDGDDQGKRGNKYLYVINWYAGLRLRDPRAIMRIKHVGNLDIVD